MRRCLKLSLRTGFCRTVGNSTGWMGEVWGIGFNRAVGLGGMNDMDKIKACSCSQKIELLDSLVLDACKSATTILTIPFKIHLVFSQLSTNGNLTVSTMKTTRFYTHCTAKKSSSLCIICEQNCFTCAYLLYCNITT